MRARALIIEIVWMYIYVSLDIGDILFYMFWFCLIFFSIQDIPNILVGGSHSLQGLIVLNDHSRPTTNAGGFSLGYINI